MIIRDIAFTLKDGRHALIRLKDGTLLNEYMMVREIKR